METAGPVQDDPEEQTGVYVVELESRGVCYLDETAKKFFPQMCLGKKCYEIYHRDSPCPTCPLEQLRENPFAIGYQKHPDSGRGFDMLALRFTHGDGRRLAMVCCGRVTLEEKRRWLEDQRYQVILMQTRTVVFHYNLQTQEYFISPHISSMLAGRYDGRLLPRVLAEDHVIHPQDEKRFAAFISSARVSTGERGDTFRLLTRDQGFQWFKLMVHSFLDEPDDKMIFGTMVNVDSEMRLRESLRVRAEFDATTGIYNKETFLNKTERLLREAPQRPRCFVRLDINRFKTVNELFGLSEGDAVLRFIGQSLRELARQGETYARLDNDVFCACLSRTDEEAVQLVKDVDERLSGYPLDFNFILSAGIYRLPRYDGQPVQIDLDRATLAQRAIKGNYVQRVRFYEAAMGEELAREHFLIGSMRRAMEERQFVIYLQPKYNMESGTVYGAEALVRWKHPKEGLIPPNVFIPLFERNGFILKLDEYVWDLTAGTIREWMDSGLTPVPVSVNVSRKNLYDTSLCDKILSIVRRHRIEPRLLELEITESAYTEEPRTLDEIMRRLQGEGFLFSMDDFGSGYSSLNMLKDIPVDELKIDLNFLTESKRKKSAGQTILETTIQMAQRLDLPVIAEGVETAAQADLLMRAGCTRAQGYLFGRPMPAESFRQLLAGRPEGRGE